MRKNWLKNCDLRVLNYIFVNLAWKTDPITSWLRFLHQGSSNYTDVQISMGDKFNIAFLSRRFCIGTDLAGPGWVSCIERQKIFHQLNLVAGKYQEIEVENKYNQCYLCRQQNYFSCRIICTGVKCEPSSERAFEICQPPDTVVYLTHIGGQIKVGVTLDITRRWLEQGSDQVTVIARTPGLEARRIEHQISEELSVKTQIRNTTKIRNLLNTKTEEVKQDLQNKVRDSKRIVDKVLSTSPGVAFSDPKIVSLSKYYGDLEFDKRVTEIEPIPGTEFGGDVMAVKGSIIIVKNSMYYYALDTKKFTSTEFQLLDRTAVIEGQASLDEWF